MLERANEALEKRVRPGLLLDEAIEDLGSMVDRRTHKLYLQDAT